MKRVLTFLAKGFEQHQWFRRGLVISTLVLVYRMTTWGMDFAERALLADKSLLDAAALVTAVGGIPVAILTILYNKYSEGRNVPDNR